MAFTAYKTSGDELPASVLQSLIAELRPIAAVKSATETIISNSTLQNDDELAVAVAASTTYDFRLILLYNSGVTPKLKFGFTFPAGTTMSYSFQGYATGVQSFMLVQTDVPVADGNAASNLAAVCDGVVATSVTAGTLQVQWAQSVLTASNSSVLAGSMLILRKAL